MATSDSRSAGSGGSTYVALLRGVNVGGKNKLPMKELASLFREAGCEAVRTYIQSGNVIYRADDELADRISDDISAAIADKHELKVPIVTRTADELGAVFEANPFITKGIDTRYLHVGFLADLPDEASVAALDPDRSPPDKYVVIGREVYSHCPNGVGRSKLTTQYFDSRLKTTMTGRNWNTVSKLLDLVREMA